MEQGDDSFLLATFITMVELIPSTPGSVNLDDLEATLGVYFVGFMFAMVLYGFTFFRAYSADDTGEAFD